MQAEPGTTRLPKPFQWLLVLAILCGLAAVLLPAIKVARSRGAAIPSQPPNAAHRIHAPEVGLSIIGPEGWTSAVRAGALSLAPPAVGRVASMLTISLHEPPGEPDTTGHRRIVLQGAPAFEKTFVERESKFDDPALTRSIVFMKVGTKWVRVEFFAQGKHSELPAAVLEYLETIQLEP